MKVKKTDRMKRDEQIAALEDEGEDTLQKLLDTMEHKHQNGGIFENLDHHTKTQLCIEEELEDV